jgi:hypothetical protein
MKNTLLIPAAGVAFLIASAIACKLSVHRNPETAMLNPRGTVRRIQPHGPDSIPLLPKPNMRQSAKKVI